MPRTVLTANIASLLFALPAVGQNTGITLTNGVDGYIEVPAATQLVPQSGITFEAWITYDDATLGTGYRYPTIVRQNVTAGQEDFFLRINANNNLGRVLRWKVVTTSGAQFVCDWPFAGGQLNIWTHVAATWDGTAAKLFVNGNQVVSTAGNGLPIWNRGGVLRIGKGDPAGNAIEVWNGQLDEVRLWPFARSQAEIQQAMNFQLYSVPGLVSTWNLDSHLLDTSGGLHAASTGTVTFTANTLALTQLPAQSAFLFGASTPGCLGALAMSFGSLPQAGNLAFAPVCTRAPANATTFLAMAFGTSPAPVSVAGIDFWLDLTTTTLVLASTSSLGVARYPVALPAWLGPGFALAFQYGFVDPCGTQGVTASNAMMAITQ